jgi:hypothetical protein
MSRASRDWPKAPSDVSEHLQLKGGFKKSLSMSGEVLFGAGAVASSGALETDAADIPGKSIGVLGHDLHGVRVIGLEDANRSGGSHPVAVKEDHDLPTVFCSAQASVIRLARTAPISVTSRSRSGSASMTSKTFSPKAPTTFLA